MGFTLKGQQYPAKELGPNNYFGEYYILTNKKSEFYYEAKTDVEAIGITKQHFVSVLDKHQDRGNKIRDESKTKYFAEIRNDIVSYSHNRSRLK